MRTSTLHFLLVPVLAAGCAVGTDDELEPEVDESGQPLIVGDEDWDDLANHAGDTGYPAGFNHGLGVAGLEITRSGETDQILCSGFLVGRDLIMTAEHCVPAEAAHAFWASFGVTAPGVAPDRYRCFTPVAIDVQLDVAIYRCEPNEAGELPGDRWPILPLSRTAPVVGEDLFRVSFECRRNEGAACARRLLFSPGGSAQTQARFDKCQVVRAPWATGFSSNCDARPGSSGAPVMRRQGDRWAVVGLFVQDYIDENIEAPVYRYVWNHDADEDAVLDVAEDKYLAGDFDGDYDEEVVRITIGHPGRLEVHGANGNAFLGAAPLWGQAWIDEDTRVLAGNFDGDWDDDLIKLDYGQPGRVWMLRSDGSGAFSATQWASWWLSPDNNFVVADFNDDGRDDIAKVDNGSPGGVWVGLSNGSGFGGSKWDTWWMTPDTHVLTGDFNGDGKADLLKIDNGSPGGVWVGITDSIATRFVTTKWADWWMNPDIQVRVGDFNADGKDDLMKIDNGSPGGVWVGISTGSSFTTWKWADWWMTSQTPLLVGRFAGNDLRQDILKVDHQWNGNPSGMWVGRSTGAAFAGAGLGAWMHQAGLGVLAADVDGDLRTDVVTVGGRGSFRVRLTP